MIYYSLGNQLPTIEQQPIQDNYSDFEIPNVISM